jgi:hypothetical protein
MNYTFVFPDKSNIIKQPHKEKDIMNLQRRFIPKNMTDVINRFPKIKKISTLPVNQRWRHIIRLSRQEKEQFVNYSNIISVKSYEGFFKNKTVAIIGPSPSIKDTDNGEDIEKHYDIIVRINKGWKHSVELDKYIGRRTDVLYNCIDNNEECGGVINTEYVKNTGLKLIIDPIKFACYKTDERDTIFHRYYRLNRYTFFHLNNKGEIPFGMVCPDKYSVWDTAADTRINTGLLAIIDILHLDVKQVYVKGFTFFKDGYVMQYRNRIAGHSLVNDISGAEIVSNYIEKLHHHDQKKQWVFFKNLLKNKHIREKIVMDNSLATIMKQEHFDE